MGWSRVSVIQKRLSQWHKVPRLATSRKVPHFICNYFRGIAKFVFVHLAIHVAAYFFSKISKISIFLIFSKILKNLKCLIPKISKFSKFQTYPFFSNFQKVSIFFKIFKISTNLKHFQIFKITKILWNLKYFKNLFRSQHPPHLTATSGGNNWTRTTQISQTLDLKAEISYNCVRPASQPDISTAPRDCRPKLH